MIKKVKYALINGTAHDIYIKIAMTSNSRNEGLPIRNGYIKVSKNIVLFSAKK